MRRLSFEVIKIIMTCYAAVTGEIAFRRGVWLVLGLMAFFYFLPPDVLRGTD